MRLQSLLAAAAATYGTVLSVMIKYEQILSYLAHCVLDSSDIGLEDHAQSQAIRILGNLRADHCGMILVLSKAWGLQ